MKFLRLGLMALLTLGFLGCKPSAPKHGLEFVLTATSPAGAPLSSNEFQRVMEVLAQRQDSLGYPAWVERRGTNCISIKVDPESKEEIEVMRTAFTRNGVLEFRLGHPEGEKLLAQEIIPGDYTKLQETSLTPGARGSGSHLVSRKALPEMANKNLARVSSGRNQANRPEIYFKFNPEGAAALARVTTENMGRELAILIDGQLYSAPRIRTPITQGSGAISGSFSMEEVSTLVAILRAPLEAKVEILEERRF